ncbi:high-potential iron-sulfur protein [Nevskia sp.]|uniref:high-potential iron-sulfur protein n=1 Tax=Nevskia sp. TaxID=1929292 RepID=UPI0025D73EB7|nr:high-potential iron-sulfur protein [Nevskia sp.]
MTDHNTLSRRRFLSLAATVAAVPVVALHSRNAAAADLPLVVATDPTAKSLGYVADAATVKSPTFKAGSACAKCALYSGAAGAASGPCGIFPGKAVAAKGWCTAYAPKA